ncbi:hypothetical protein DFH08DRAFT_1086557 [Mycena albidolilacea]|uniref:Uncharacterized protein n=1 Tax=Mycena albidolilacea TaxID=1033008 RepID=A0AAD7EG77_9AGAR|nr:hypothetical protein DFH08DRAFT_1086557 [Mycena albidolilacea]
MAVAPTFPAEIEHEFFETTALTHPGTIPALLRIAQRPGIEPLLYRSIRLNIYGENMVRLLVESKPPKLFRDAVRHLALESDSESSAAERQHLLELCKEIASFLSDYDVLDPTFLPFRAETRVQRLSLKLGAMFGISWDIPIYPPPNSPSNPHSVE